MNEDELLLEMFRQAGIQFPVGDGVGPTPRGNVPAQTSGPTPDPQQIPPFYKFPPVPGDRPEPAWTERRDYPTASDVELPRQVGDVKQYPKAGPRRGQSALLKALGWTGSSVAGTSEKGEEWADAPIYKPAPQKPAYDSQIGPMPASEEKELQTKRPAGQKPEAGVGPGPQRAEVRPEGLTDRQRDLMIASAHEDMRRAGRTAAGLMPMTAGGVMFHQRFPQERDMSGEIELGMAASAAQPMNDPQSEESEVWRQIASSLGMQAPKNASAATIYQSLGPMATVAKGAYDKRAGMQKSMIDERARWQRSTSFRASQHALSGVAGVEALLSRPDVSSISHKLLVRMLLKASGEGARMSDQDVNQVLYRGAWHQFLYDVANEKLTGNITPELIQQYSMMTQDLGQAVKVALDRRAWDGAAGYAKIMGMDVGQVHDMIYAPSGLNDPDTGDQVELIAPNGDTVMYDAEKAEEALDKGYTLAGGETLQGESPEINASDDDLVRMAKELLKAEGGY